MTNLAARRAMAGVPRLLGIALAVSACARDGGPATQATTQPSTRTSVMESLDQKDPDKLAAAAVAHAASDSPADQQRLREAMGSREFLSRLNTEEEYGRLRAEKLRIAEVLAALAKNQAPAARETLSFLAGNPQFTAEEARQDLLLRALVPVRPATPAVAAFFDAQMRPDASNLHLAVDCVVANGSPPAIAVLERNFASPEQEPENLAGWMHDAVLRHRYDVPLLEACERLLKGGKLPAGLDAALVEALFDYRPAEWYPPDSDRPRPPDRSTASPEARAILRRIGQWAEGRDAIPKALQARVRAELDALK